MHWKTTIASLVVAIGLAFGGSAGKAAPLAVGGGWVPDTAPALSTPTTGSPWTFTLLGSGVFSITDAFVITDTYTVSDSGGVLLTTSPGLLPVLWPLGSDPTADAAWATADYSKGQLFLGPGSYSLTVEDIADAGLPAGLYVRVDLVSVPTPHTLGLFAVGLAALTFMRRRNRMS